MKKGRRSEPSDREWMQLAIDEANSGGPDVPVGCLVVKEGRILGRGHNQREELDDPTGHAEILALRQAGAATGSWRLDGATVYTTLEPCPMCAEAIIQARVPRLVFGAYDPASGACGSAFNLFVQGRIFPIPEVIGGIREQECKAMLVDFFRRKTGS